MELSKARKIAIEICEKLDPYCTKLHIAGSIRRKKLDVKDIEICCIPKIKIIQVSDLFSGQTTKQVIEPNFIATVDALGRIEKGSPSGRYCKIALSSLINVDLFIPEPSDFYRQYVIRTGSADFSHRVIANAWRKMGWVGSDLGLRREEDCIETKQPDGKSKWTCVRNKNNQPPHWTSEIEFFNWLNLNYVEPHFRNL